MGFIGSKGGGGSAPQPTQTPDNLRSKDTVEVILGISEGPIVGLEDGSKSFFVGNTPLQNENGELNFQNFDLKFQQGWETDDPIKPKLGGAGNNTSVNTSLSTNLPVVRQTTSGNIDAIDIRLNVQRLLRSTTEGTFHHTLEVDIAYKPSNEAVWRPFFDGGERLTLTGKTSSTYVKEMRRTVERLPDGVAYDIRVVKRTAENDNENYADVAWESFQEVQNEARSYPNTSVVQLVAEATDQFSSIPQFSGIYKGMIVQVPSNYDASTRAYTGTWDGTFKASWTDNPAWILYDFVTNDRYGMSAYFPVYLDKWDVYEAARWCDEPVDNGQGGTQPRYTFNAIMAEPRSGREMARYLAGVFNATFFDDQNGTAFLRVDKDDPAVHLFAPENVVDGIFDYTFTDYTSRYNDITVTFINPLLDWNEDRRRVFDEDHINKYGRIPLDFVAVGCIDEHEAIRRAYYKLITATTEITTVSFKTNRLGQFVQPFDVMLISDPDVGYGISGRFKSWSGNSVQLRDPVYLEAGVTYKVKVHIPGGVWESTLVSPSAGYNYSLTFAAAPPANTNQQATFVVEQEGGLLGMPKPFRVMKVSEVDGNPDMFEIVGIEINRNKWYGADNATTVGTIDYTFKPGATVPAPTNLRVQTSNRLDMDRPRVDLTLSWDRPKSALIRRFRILFRRGDNTDFQLYTETNGLSVVFEDIPEGTYEFAVVSVDINDRYSAQAVIGYTVSYEFYDDNLPRVTGLELFGQGNDTNFIGKNPKFSWRVNYPTGYFEMGQEPQGANQLINDPFFRDFIVQIYDVQNNELVRTESVKDLTYIYDFERNLEDGGPRRRFKILVSYRNTRNKISFPASLEVYNPPPELPVNLAVIPAVGTILVSCDYPTDPDFAGMVVWMQPSADFDPYSTEMAYKGPDVQVALKSDPNQSYYVRVALFDVFGVVDLKISDPVFIRALFTIDDQPPAIPTGLSVTSRMTEEGVPVVEASWNENTDEDFASYSFAIKEGNEPWQFGTIVSEPFYSWEVKPGRQYCVKVRAHDFNGNTSGYSPEQCVTSVRDEIPPQAPTALNATASFRSVWLSWTNPADADLSHVQVYENVDPTISTATLLGEVTGNTFARTGLEPGDVRYYWLKAVDTSGNISTTAGPVQATTASLQLADFPASFGPIPLVNELPVEGPQSGVQYVFLTTDQKLYKWDGTAWKPAVSFDEVDGVIRETQIAPDTIKAPMIKANEVQAIHMAADSVTAGAIKAGAVTAAALATDNVITKTAQIADAIIDDAKIVDLSADKIKANTTLSGTVIVGNRTMEQIRAWADDPANRVNEGTTLINPGLIHINGGTKLSDWRNGPNSTEIRGGAIAANTITANRLTVGNRGISVDGFDFQPDKANNRLSWTTGYVTWTSDTGVVTTTTVNGGSVTYTADKIYIYWSKGASSLVTTTVASEAHGDDKIIFCTYIGGAKFVANYGGVIIDGDSIVANSIRATQLVANSITTREIDVEDVLTASNIRSGTLSTSTIYVGDPRFTISSPNRRIQISDQNGVTRVLLGNIGNGQDGIEIRDSSGNVTLTSGGKVNVSGITGLGSLATQNSVSTSQVTGLGSLATKNWVNIDEVNGAGALARVSKIYPWNATTYIESGAIGNALIGQAAIDTAHIRDLAVDTIKVKDGAISNFSGATGGGGATTYLSITGSGGYVYIYASVNAYANAYSDHAIKGTVNASIVVDGGDQTGGVTVLDGLGINCSSLAHIVWLGAGTHSIAVHINAWATGTVSVGASRCTVWAQLLKK